MFLVVYNAAKVKNSVQNTSVFSLNNNRALTITQ